MGGQRHARRLDLAQPPTIVERVRRPVQQAGHDVALGETRVPGLDHFADGATGERLVELEGGHIGVELGHARPHVGIERQEQRAHQDLAVGQGRRGRRLGAEAVRRDVAHRALGEDDLSDFGHGSFLSSKSLRR
jgi:hypothetical protein